MNPRIELLSEKKLVGLNLRMSLVNNTTYKLWSSFMIRRKEIENVVSTDLFSMQVYDNDKYFSNFSPQTEFVKWAAAEVHNFNSVPDGFETYELKGGLYAIFIHHGLPSDFKKTFDQIFGVWLPQSTYTLDHREHFELLGAKYKNNHPDSEEEIWIPIKAR